MEILLPKTFETIHVNQNEKFWKGASGEDIDRYADFLFNHYRKTGYPHYSTATKDELKKSIQQIRKYGIQKVIEKDIVKQTMHGLAELWSYFPHYLEIKCNNSPTVIEAWNDDKLLKRAIMGRLKHGSYMGDSSMRKGIRAFSAQAVSNFRPSAAAAIYQYAHKMLNREGKTLRVWDMCAGWGGRLMGAYTSEVVRQYIANEPSTKTWLGLQKLKSHLIDIDIEENEEETFWASISSRGCEEKNIEHYILKETIDVCFTSPPYFDTEKYSDEESQSYKKYPTYNLWKTDFLQQTVKNCSYALKTDGLLILNVANAPRAKTLESDTLEILKSEGFEITQTLKLQLSGRSGKSSNGDYRYEPIFIANKIKP